MSTEWHSLIKQYRYFAFRAKRASEELLDAAIEVRRRTFRQEYGVSSHIDFDEYDPTGIHVLAYLGDQAVSSFRINPPGSPCGFELTALANIRSFPACGPLVAEASKFAIPPEHRRISAASFMTLGLIKAAFVIAQLEKFSDYVTWVRPEISSIYRIWGFVDIPTLRFGHPNLANLPHQVVRLDLTQFNLCEARKRWVSQIYHDPVPPNLCLLL
jgi:N-acyl-L-homoserine lactone synthetase